jgi:hypothetical protein
VQWLYWSSGTLQETLKVFLAIHIPHLRNFWLIHCSCLHIRNATSCMFSLSSTMCGWAWVHLLNIPKWQNHMAQLQRWCWTGGSCGCKGCMSVVL